MQTEDATTSEPTEQIVVEGDVDMGQQAAFEELAAQSSGQTEVLAQEGQIRYLSVNIHVPDSIAVSAQEKASYFLQQNRQLLKVEDPNREFRAGERSINENGTTFVRYEQVYKGIPVYGSETIVEISKEKEIKSVMAGYSPTLIIDVQPVIRSIQAERIVLEIVGNPQGEVAQPATLVIYDPSFIESSLPSTPHLAWEVVIPSAKDGIRSYLVDARTGEILESFDELLAGLDRMVWDAQRIPDFHNDLWIIDALYYSKQVMNESGPIGEYQPVDDSRRAWEHSKTIYDYYHNHFGRDSIDGKGGGINLYVNIGDCNNSFWSPTFSIAVFCDGYTSIDIVAHELTHGIWSRGLRGYYKYEAAALNESFSDIFAAFIDNIDPWRITVDDSTDRQQGQRILRDISDLQGRNLPIHYSQYDKNKDPHINSTINSYAAFLLSEGTAQGRPINGIIVEGIGREKAQYIYYNVMTYRLKIWVNFKETRKAAIAACKELIGSHGIITSDCDQVMNAYAAIGIGEPAKEASNPPGIPYLNAPNNFWDNFSNSWRDELRQAVNDLLGKWSPIALWQPYQEKIDELRSNYWVHLVECFVESDQACINQFAAELIIGISNLILAILMAIIIYILDILYEILQSAAHACSTLFVLPLFALLIRNRRLIKYE